MFKCLRNFLTKKHHGNHVFADFIWDVNKELIDNTVLSENIFQIMKDSIKNTKMKNVHEKLVILDDYDTLPGFTSCILIDESHITAHCYSTRGWLSIDAFSCGDTHPEPIMNYIVAEIKKLYPSLKCTYKKNHKRFHYI